MPIRIERKSITDFETDAIVNAANSALLAGGGVCGAIFHAAGYAELTKECNAIGHCDTGCAVMTPAFSLKAKAILHTVGPIWQGGRSGEAELLRSCYINTLTLAAQHGLREVVFPLISAGIYGYPKEQAWREAIAACRQYLETNPTMQIIFAVLDAETEAMGETILSE